MSSLASSGGGGGGRQPPKKPVPNVKEEYNRSRKRRREEQKEEKKEDMGSPFGSNLFDASPQGSVGGDGYTSQNRLARYTITGVIHAGGHAGGMGNILNPSNPNVIANYVDDDEVQYIVPASPNASDNESVASSIYAQSPQGNNTPSSAEGVSPSSVGSGVSDQEDSD